MLACSALELHGLRGAIDGVMPQWHGEIYKENGAQRVGKTQRFLAEAVKTVELQAAGAYSTTRRQWPRGIHP